MVTEKMSLIFMQIKNNYFEIDPDPTVPKKKYGSLTN